VQHNSAWTRFNSWSSFSWTKIMNDVGATRPKCWEFCTHVLWSISSHSVILACVVLTGLQGVTDRQTDGCLYDSKDVLSSAVVHKKTITFIMCLLTERWHFAADTQVYRSIKRQWCADVLRHRQRLPTVFLITCLSTRLAGSLGWVIPPWEGG